METKTFRVHPSDLSRKIEQLTIAGWNIASTIDTSTPITKPDAHGMSYGGREITIVAKR